MGRKRKNDNRPFTTIAVPKEMARELGRRKYMNGYDKIHEVIEELLGKKRRPTG